MNETPTKHHTLTFLAIVLGLLVLILVGTSFALTIKANKPSDFSLASISLASSTRPVSASLQQLILPGTLITHKKTPTEVRAIYISSWYASSKTAREKLLKKIENTSINTIVLDVKDPNGKILVKLDAPDLSKYGSQEVRVADIVDFINELHQKDYYVIGHISVFQDNYLTRIRPDLAMRRLDNNELWQDKKGMAWLDVSQPEVWDYVIAIAREAYAVGFDELNFDYVRFPSDGELSQIRYRNYDPTKETRVEALKKFFVYLHSNLGDIGAPTSANVFGMVTTNDDDLGIGQVMSNVAPYVDYVAPMIYPSHYPKGWQGYKNPSANPYQVVKISLTSGLKKLEELDLPKEKLRPWLQDFNLGSTYNATKIKAEFKAVTDVGLGSWMMWNSACQYTVNAYPKKET